MRLIDADALKEKISSRVQNEWTQLCIDLIDSAPTVEMKPFAAFSFNKDELNQIVEERVIEPIKNGDLVVKTEERPQGEWIIAGAEGGAFGIAYKIRKCSNCGWEHSLIIPDNFCSNCGADMRGGKENEDTDTRQYR